MAHVSCNSPKLTSAPLLSSRHRIPARSAKPAWPPRVASRSRAAVSSPAEGPALELLLVRVKPLTVTSKATVTALMASVAGLMDAGADAVRLADRLGDACAGDRVSVRVALAVRVGEDAGDGDDRRDLLMEGVDDDVGGAELELDSEGERDGDAAIVTVTDGDDAALVDSETETEGLVVGLLLPVLEAVGDADEEADSLRDDVTVTVAEGVALTLEVDIMLAVDVDDRLAVVVAVSVTVPLLLPLAVMAALELTVAVPDAGPVSELLAVKLRLAVALPLLEPVIEPEGVMDNVSLTVAVPLPLPVADADKETELVAASDVEAVPVAAADMEELELALALTGRLPVALAVAVDEAEAEGEVVEAMLLDTLPLTVPVAVLLLVLVSEELPVPVAVEDSDSEAVVLALAVADSDELGVSDSDMLTVAVSVSCAAATEASGARTKKTICTANGSGGFHETAAALLLLQRDRKSLERFLPQPLIMSHGEWQRNEEGDACPSRLQKLLSISEGPSVLQPQPGRPISTFPSAPVSRSY